MKNTIKLSIEKQQTLWSLSRNEKLTSIKLSTGETVKILAHKLEDNLTLPIYLEKANGYDALGDGTYTVANGDSFIIYEGVQMKFTSAKQKTTDRIDRLFAAVQARGKNPFAADFASTEKPVPTWTEKQRSDEKNEIMKGSFGRVSCQGKEYVFPGPTMQVGSSLVNDNQEYAQDGTYQMDPPNAGSFTIHNGIISEIRDAKNTGKESSKGTGAVNLSGKLSLADQLRKENGYPVSGLPNLKINFGK
jgi:hypothetical protein